MVHFDFLDVNKLLKYLAYRFYCLLQQCKNVGVKHIIQPILEFYCIKTQNNNIQHSLVCFMTWLSIETIQHQLHHLDMGTDKK